MENLERNINLFEKEFKSALESANTQEQLEKARVAFLGRNGKIVDLMSQMKELPLEEKRTFGPKLNQLKKKSEQAYKNIKVSLEQEVRKLEILRKQQFDVTAYKPTQLEGSAHILSKVVEQIEDIFISMGYKVADGPELETEFYNFEALNIPANHPARDSQDTFWFDVPGMLLRTQTSTIQIHEMEKHGTPIALIGTGRVYRNESTDATHDFVFSQVEGLFVDKNISMGNLLATMKTFLQQFFGKKDLDIRVRPGFFPFVEPGIEIDASCPFCKDGCSVCKKTKFIELVGAGLVHPNVLQYCNVNPQAYNGFAFGFGIERLAMVKYGINDLRLFHGSNLDFLKQF
ncbi:phenylalanine--tRNA ligase subunit alpha [Candidatus Dependentiae bacterium]